MNGCETPLGSWADEDFTPNAVSVAVGTPSDSVLLDVVELSVGCPGDVALTSMRLEGCCGVLVYVVSATRPVQYPCNKATACRTSVLTMYRGHNRRPHYAHRGPQCLTRERYMARLYDEHDGRVGVRNVLVCGVKVKCGRVLTSLSLPGDHPGRGQEEEN